MQIIAKVIPVGRRVRTSGRTMAYESSADEATFVFGPVLVGLLATVLGAAAAMIGAVALTAIFVTAFALHPSAAIDTPAAQGRATPAPVVELFRWRVVIVVGGALAMGTVFGSFLTALTAFMEDRGNSDAAGLLYGIFGVGSALFALAVAVVPERFALRARWICTGALIAAGAVIFGLSSGPAGIVVGLAVAGSGAGPTVVTLFTFAAARAPAGRSSTVMTMLGSAVIVGQAGVSAATGAVADAAGTAAAQWFPAAAGVAVLVTGVLNAFVVDRPATPVTIATGAQNASRAPAR